MSDEVQPTCWFTEMDCPACTGPLATDGRRAWCVDPDCTFDCLRAEIERRKAVTEVGCG